MVGGDTSTQLSKKTLTLHDFVTWRDLRSIRPPTALGVPSGGGRSKLLPRRHSTMVGVCSNHHHGATLVGRDTSTNSKLQIANAINPGVFETTLLKKSEWRNTGREIAKSNFEGAHLEAPSSLPLAPCSLLNRHRFPHNPLLVLIMQFLKTCRRAGTDTTRDQFKGKLWKL